MNKVLLCCLFLLYASSLLEAGLPKLRKCRELVKTVRELKQYVSDNDPEFLHAPHGVKTECLDLALMCFRNQTTQLKVADGQNKAMFSILIRHLKMKVPHLSKDMNCIACSAYATQRPKKFLGYMEKLLQQILSQLPNKSS